MVSALAFLLAVVLTLLGVSAEAMQNVEMYVAFSSVLGFLLAFRSNQAYSRFWSGAETLRVAVKEEPLEEQYEKAVSRVNAAATRKDQGLEKVRNDTEKGPRLYALFKQVQEGDVTAKAPW